MALNLSTIRDEVKSQVHNSSLSNTKIDRWVNMTQDLIASRMDADHLVETTTFSTVADQRAYNIKTDILKIKSVIDQTGDYDLTEISESQLEAFDPDRSDTGTPTHYSLYGMVESLNQPSSASVVSIVSSSASDTSQTVRINGIVSGAEDTDSVTLTGAVSAATTKSFTSITSIRKSATTVGYITCTTNAGGVTVVTIPPARLSNQYQPINLYPIPTDVRTLLVRYIRIPRPLVNLEDMPDLPEGRHELVLLGVLIKAHEHLYEYQRANELRAIFENEVKNFKIDQGNTRNSSRKLKGQTIWSKVLGRYPSNFGV